MLRLKLRASTNALLSPPPSSPLAHHPVFESHLGKALTPSHSTTALSRQWTAGIAVMQVARTLVRTATMRPRQYTSLACASRSALDVRTRPPTTTTSWPTWTMVSAYTPAAWTRLGSTMMPRRPSTMAGARRSFSAAQTRSPTITRATTIPMTDLALMAAVRTKVLATTWRGQHSTTARALAGVVSCSTHPMGRQNAVRSQPAASTPQPPTMTQRLPVTSTTCASTTYLAARTRQRLTTSPPPSKSARPPTAPSPSMDARLPLYPCCLSSPKAQLLAQVLLP